MTFCMQKWPLTKCKNSNSQISSIFFLKVGGLNCRLVMSSSRIVWAWKCQNWPMKVSKDHILKQNENAYCKCSCRRMKCKREEDAWNKFEEIGMACAQAWQAQIEKSSWPWTPTPLKAWSKQLQHRLCNPGLFADFSKCVVVSNPYTVVIELRIEMRHVTTNYVSSMPLL